MTNFKVVCYVVIDRIEEYTLHFFLAFLKSHLPLKAHCRPHLLHDVKLTYK